MGEAQCADCHTPPLFHDVSFRNIGLHGQLSDLGVEEVTGLWTTAGGSRPRPWQHRSDRPLHA